LKPDSKRIIGAQPVLDHHAREDHAARVVAVGAGGRAFPRHQRSARYIVEGVGREAGQSLMLWLRGDVAGECDCAID